MSTAYYALFHALCRNAADTLIGKTRASRSQPAWLQTYRAVEHGFAKGQCKDRRTISRFPGAIQDFAEGFVFLQERRHGADYDPSSRFRLSEAETLIERAEEAIAAFERAPLADRRAFAAFVLLKPQRR